MKSHNIKTGESQAASVDKKKPCLIKNVEHAGDYFLYVTFTDGTARMIDLKPLLLKSAMYKPFLNISKFKKFKFTPITIEWPGNILDRHIKHLLN